MDEEKLRKIEGLQTVETIAEALNIKMDSALNLICKLKKQGYITTSGGGRQKRLYKVTLRKQRKRDKGMFDVINKYSPMKLNPWYDHQVHGKYGPEEALVDAVQTRSFRVILASLRLFNHIVDWKKLHAMAKERDVWQQIGALYDTSKLYFRARKMPKRYLKPGYKKKEYLIRDYLTKEDKYKRISKIWNVEIPFREKDMAKVTT